jgi:hypothetical protein
VVAYARSKVAGLTMTEPVVLPMFQYMRYCHPSSAQYLISTSHPGHSRLGAQQVDRENAKLVLALASSWAYPDSESLVAAKHHVHTNPQPTLDTVRR